MFDIGFWELVIVCVVALVVIGPERLPRVARTAGLWLGRARRIVGEVRAEVERELQLEDLKQSIRQQETVDELKRLADRVKTINADLNQPVDSGQSDVPAPGSVVAKSSIETSAPPTSPPK